MAVNGRWDLIQRLKAYTTQCMAGVSAELVRPANVYRHFYKVVF